MRWARRMGRRERVKFAERKRVSALRGGRPCLKEESVYSRLTARLAEKLPNEICQGQWVQWLRSKACDLVVVNIDCCWRVGPWTAARGLA